MKDAMGHGSEAGVGTHATAIQNLPVKGSPYTGMDDKTYQATMPKENYTGMVQDMLGMWDGTQKPGKLSSTEQQTVDTAYTQRKSWRDVAKGLHDNRQSVAT